MIRAAAVNARLGLALMLLAVLGLSTPAHAVVVIDYDDAFEDDFYTDPHLEDGTTTTVDSGHYDIFGDPTGDLDDLMMNIDDDTGFTQLTFTVDGAVSFDAISMDIIDDPANSGDFTISAIGGSGSVSPGPTETGILVFGPGFQNITGLLITQNASGFFAWDDLTIDNVVVPEPSTAGLLGLGVAGLALRRRRS